MNTEIISNIKMVHYGEMSYHAVEVFFSIS